MSEQLLTDAELAGECGVSVWTVRDWRRRGIGPRVTRLSPQSIRYSRADVDAWLLTCRENSAASA